MSERLKPQVKTIVTLTPRHGEDHPSSPALSRRPPLVIIHPDAQQEDGPRRPVLG